MSLDFPQKVQSHNGLPDPLTLTISTSPLLECALSLRCKSYLAVLSVGDGIPGLLALCALTSC